MTERFVLVLVWLVRHLTCIYVVPLGYFSAAGIDWHRSTVEYIYYVIWLERAGHQIWILHKGVLVFAAT
jgi:hypothetical protein